MSVMTRMRQADGFSLDYEVGRLQCIVLGGFRPLVGAVFGTVAYFALQSGFININPPKGDELFYFALISFLAGFSERFAQVILGGAELSVAKALPGAELIKGNEVQTPTPTAERSTSAEPRHSPPDDRE
jgi:ABC-type branched-subunit amino acid transport system permease subunit